MIRLVLVLSPGVSCLAGALIGWVIDWSIDQFTPRYFRQPEWTPPVRPAAAAASRAPKPFRTHRRSGAADADGRGVLLMLTGGGYC